MPTPKPHVLMPMPASLPSLRHEVPGVVLDNTIERNDDFVAFDDTQSISTVSPIKEAVYTPLAEIRQTTSDKARIMKGDISPSKRC